MSTVTILEIFDEMCRLVIINTSQRQENHGQLIIDGPLLC